MGAIKTVFRMIRGRLVPIRVALGKVGIQDEAVNIAEVQKARKFAKEEGLDSLSGAFWKYTRERSHKTGTNIARRIARFKSKGER